jgi:hypothetical protein
MFSKDMSIGERAPLRGYINKPSFSIVIIIYFYQLFIFLYIIIQLHTWLYTTLVSEQIGPSQKHHNPYHKSTPSLPPYPSHPVPFPISRNFFPTKFPSRLKKNNNNNN